MVAAASAAPTTPPVPPSIVMLGLEQIAESPSNPRKTFAAVEDLAADLREHGVLSPVLVRVQPGRDPGDVRYELVFGARRFRAAKLAQLTHIPAMVAELDDREVLERQIVENSQREDVHPLEEAEGYEELHQKHGLSVDDIAVKVNKSVSSIYARMKLCALCKEARKAFYDGGLSPSTALYVARIPHADLQREALKELSARNGDPVGSREASDIIRRRFMLKLKDAPFVPSDATLVAKAGSCSTCPKRTGAQPGLFFDVEGADVCTDPKCWEEKRLASVAGAAKAFEAKGVKVVAGERSRYGHEIRPPKGYGLLTDYDYERGRTLGGALKKLPKDAQPKAKAVMFDEAGKPVDVVRLAAIPKLDRQADRARVAGNRERHESNNKVQEAKRKAGKEIVALVTARAKKELTIDAGLRLLSYALDLPTWGPGDRASKARATLDKLKGQALLGELFALALEHEVYTEGMYGGGAEDAYPTLLGALLKHFQIDAAAMVEAAAAKARPKPKKEEKPKAPAKKGARVVKKIAKRSGR